MKCGSQPTPVSIQHTWSSGKRSNTPVNSIDGDVAGGHREHVAHAADRLGARRLARHVVELVAGLAPRPCGRLARCRRLMMLMWTETGRPSSTAAAQNGSSSRERLSPPDGQFEISTPFAPRAFALRSASIDVSMPSDGICARPIEPRRVGRAELLEQEVVVRLDAGEHEVVVVVTEEVAHRALRREQDLGRHAVDVHVLEARRRRCSNRRAPPRR